MTVRDPFAPDWLLPHVIARAGGDGYPETYYCGQRRSGAFSDKRWIWPAAISDKPICRKCRKALAQYATQGVADRD